MSNDRDLTRAELVRRRRAQRSVKELEQTTKRALKPMVPVTSRTAITSPRGALSAPSKPGLVARPRRFNAALGLPEFYLHRPKISMPRLHASWRFASILIALLLGAAIYFALTLPYFFVPAATVLGNNRLSREEINAVLGVADESIFAVQPQDVKTRLLMNYPELLSAQVNVYLPNHVYVTVVERQPVILWQKGEGYTWIDDSGVAFRPRGLADALVPVFALEEPLPGVPLDLLSPPPYMQKELVDAILALAPLVPAGSTLTFDSTQGLSWTDSRGWQASFGVTANDMPLKIRVYQSLVDSLIARGKLPEYINVVYPDAPFYRMPENVIQETTEEETVSAEQ